MPDARFKTTNSRISECEPAQIYPNAKDAMARKGNRDFPSAQAIANATNIKKRISPRSSLKPEQPKQVPLTHPSGGGKGGGDPVRKTRRDVVVTA